MQQYDRLKKLIRPTAWFLFITLFMVIAESRSVNKNVSIYIQTLLSEQNGIQSWTFMKYRRTIKPVVTSIRL